MLIRKSDFTKYFVTPISSYILLHSSPLDETTKTGLLALLEQAQAKKKMAEKADGIENMVAEFRTKSWSENEVQVEIAIHILKELGDFEKNMEAGLAVFQALPATTTKILREMYNEIIANYRIRKGSSIIENTGFVTAWRGLALLFLNPGEEDPLFEEIDERVDEGVGWAKELAILGHRRHISRLRLDIDRNLRWLDEHPAKSGARSTREKENAAALEEIDRIVAQIADLE